MVCFKFKKVIFVEKKIIDEYGERHTRNLVNILYGLQIDKRNIHDT